ncbi:hypothetical protein LJR290_006160 [Variovorax sp. LjRoot290]|uniref:hypothetical protein n=1 Tax=Variovorax sp. LjRoot290 TaxID=3342316 RepID=UPI003ED0658C
MLAEVDRARQTAKALESELAREQQRRVKGEEAAAKRLEGELEKLHQVREAARHAEAGLREQLAAQGIELAQARTQAEALGASVEALQGRIDDEKASHEQTRRMLAEALISKSAAKTDTSVRRRRKP